MGKKANFDFKELTKEAARKEVIELPSNPNLTENSPEYKKTREAGAKWAAEKEVKDRLLELQKQEAERLKKEAEAQAAEEQRIADEAKRLQAEKDSIQAEREKAAQAKIVKEQIEADQAKEKEKEKAKQAKLALRASRQASFLNKALMTDRRISIDENGNFIQIGNFGMGIERRLTEEEAKQFMAEDEAEFKAAGMPNVKMRMIDGKVEYYEYLDLTNQRSLQSLFNFVPKGLKGAVTETMFTSYDIFHNMFDNDKKNISYLKHNQRLKDYVPYDEKTYNYFKRELDKEEGSADLLEKQAKLERRNPAYKDKLKKEFLSDYWKSINDWVFTSEKEDEKSVLEKARMLLINDIFDKPPGNERTDLINLFEASFKEKIGTKTVYGGIGQPQKLQIAKEKQFQENVLKAQAEIISKYYNENSSFDPNLGKKVTITDPKTKEDRTLNLRVYDNRPGFEKAIEGYRRRKAIADQIESAMRERVRKEENMNTSSSDDRDIKMDETPVYSSTTYETKDRNGNPVNLPHVFPKERTLTGSKWDKEEIVVDNNGKAILDKNGNPVYKNVYSWFDKTTRTIGKALSTEAGWEEIFEGASSVVQFGAPTMFGGAGLGAAGRFLGASSKTMNWTNTVLFGVFSNEMESREIGRDAYNKVMERGLSENSHIDLNSVIADLQERHVPKRDAEGNYIKDENGMLVDDVDYKVAYDTLTPYTEEEANRIGMAMYLKALRGYEITHPNLVQSIAVQANVAKEIATATNRYLIPLQMFETHLLLRPFKGKVAGMSMQKVPKFWSWGGVGQSTALGVGEAFKEGAEEVWNNFSTEYGMAKAEGKDYDFFSDFDLSSQENVQAAILGFILGGTTSVVTEGVTLKRRQKEYNEQKKVIEEFNKLPEEVQKATIQQVITGIEFEQTVEIAAQIAEAEQRGDKATADALKESLLINRAAKAVQTGTADVFINNLKKMAEQNPEIAGQVAEAVKFVERMAETYDAMSEAQRGRHTVLQNQGNIIYKEQKIQELQRIKEKIREERKPEMERLQAEYDTLEKQMQDEIQKEKAKISKTPPVPGQEAQRLKELEDAEAKVREKYSDRLGQLTADKVNLGSAKDAVIDIAIQNLKTEIAELVADNEKIKSKAGQKELAEKEKARLKKAKMGQITKDNKKEMIKLMEIINGGPLSPEEMAEIEALVNYDPVAEAKKEEEQKETKRIEKINAEYDEKRNERNTKEDELKKKIETLEADNKKISADSKRKTSRAKKEAAENKVKENDAKIAEHQAELDKLESLENLETQRAEALTKREPVPNKTEEQQQEENKQKDSTIPPINPPKVENDEENMGEYSMLPEDLAATPEYNAEMISTLEEELKEKQGKLAVFETQQKNGVNRTDAIAQLQADIAELTGRVEIYKQKQDAQNQNTQKQETEQQSSTETKTENLTETKTEEQQSSPAPESKPTQNQNQNVNGQNIVYGDFIEPDGHIFSRGNQQQDQKSKIVVKPLKTKPDEATVHLAPGQEQDLLSNPNSIQGVEIQNSKGANTIVEQSAGKAKLVDGHWVITKPLVVKGINKKSKGGEVVVTQKAKEVEESAAQGQQEINFSEEEKEVRNEILKNAEKKNSEPEKDLTDQSTTTEGEADFLFSPVLYDENNSTDKKLKGNFLTFLNILEKKNGKTLTFDEFVKEVIGLVGADNFARFSDIVKEAYNEKNNEHREEVNSILEDYISKANQTSDNTATNSAEINKENKEQTKEAEKDTNPVKPDALDPATGEIVRGEGKGRVSYFSFKIPFVSQRYEVIKDKDGKIKIQTTDKRILPSAYPFLNLNNLRVGSKARITLPTQGGHFTEKALGQPLTPYSKEGKTNPHSTFGELLSAIFGVQGEELNQLIANNTVEQLIEKELALTGKTEWKDSQVLRRLPCNLEAAGISTEEGLSRGAHEVDWWNDDNTADFTNYYLSKGKTQAEAEALNAAHKKGIIEKAEAELVKLRTALVKSKNHSIGMKVQERSSGMSLEQDGTMQSVNEANSEAQIATLSLKGDVTGFKINGKEFFRGKIVNREAIMSKSNKNGAAFMIVKAGYELMEDGTYAPVYVALELHNNHNQESLQGLKKAADEIQAAWDFFFNGGRVQNSMSQEVAIQILARVLENRHGQRKDKVTWNQWVRERYTLKEKRKSVAEDDFNLIHNAVATLIGSYNKNDSSRATGVYPETYQENGESRLRLTTKLAMSPSGKVITEIKVVDGKVSFEEKTYTEVLKDNLHTPRKFATIYDEKGNEHKVMDIQPRIMLDYDNTAENEAEQLSPISEKVLQEQEQLKSDLKKKQEQAEQAEAERLAKEEEIRKANEEAKAAVEKAERELAQKEYEARKAKYGGELEQEEKAQEEEIQKVHKEYEKSRKETKLDNEFEVEKGKKVKVGDKAKVLPKSVRQVEQPSQATKKKGTYNAVTRVYKDENGKWVAETTLFDNEAEAVKAIGKRTDEEADAEYEAVREVYNAHADKLKELNTAIGNPAVQKTDNKKTEEIREKTKEIKEKTDEPQGKGPVKKFGDKHINTIKQNQIGNTLRNIDLDKEVTISGVLQLLEEQYDKTIQQLKDKGLHAEAAFMTQNRDVILGNGVENFRDGLKADLLAFFYANDSEMSNSETEVKKNYSKSSSEQAINMTLGMKAKIFLAGIEAHESSSLYPAFGGLKTYYNVDYMISAVQKAYVMAKDNSMQSLFDAMTAIQVMSERPASKKQVKMSDGTIQEQEVPASKPYAFYDEIKARMKAIMDDKSGKSQDVVKTLQYSLYNAAVDMSYVQYRMGRDGYFHTRVFDADSKNPKFKVRDGFINSLKQSSLIKMTDSKKYEIVEKEVERLEELYNALVQAEKKRWEQYSTLTLLAKSDYDFATEAAIIKEFLSKFGFNLEEGSERLLADPNYNSKIKLMSSQAATGGLMTILLNNAKQALVRQKEGQQLEFGEGEKDSNHKGNLSVYDNASNFNALTDMQLRMTFNPQISTYISHKTVNKYEQPKFITEQLKRYMGQDPTYRNKARQSAYSRSSMLLSLLQEPSLREKFGLGTVSFNAIQDAANRSKESGEISELSLKDQTVALMAFFTNTIANISEMQYTTEPDYNVATDKIGLRLARIAFPTISDTGNMPLLTAPVIDMFRKDNVLIEVDEKGNITFQDKLIKHMFEQLVLPDLNRIVAFLRSGATANMDAHNTGAALILGLPGLNGLIIQDTKGRKVTLIEAIKQSIVSPSLDGNYSSFEQLLVENRSMIEKAMMDNVTQEIDSYFKMGQDGKATGLYVDQGLYRPAEEGKSSSLTGIDKIYISKIEGTWEQRARLAAADFVINYMVGQSNIQMLFAGDLANYVKESPKIDGKQVLIQGQLNSELTKGEIENHAAIYEEAFGRQTGVNLSKRLKSYVSPGNRLANAFGRNSIQLVINDNEQVSNSLKYYAEALHNDIYNSNEEYRNYLDEFTRLNRMAPEDRTETMVVDGVSYNKYKYLNDQIKKIFPGIAPYMKMAHTDGQEQVTWQEHLLQLLEQGRISQAKYGGLVEKLESQAKNGVNAQNELNEEELKVVFQPTKPLYSGLHFEDVQGKDEYGNPTGSVYKAQRYVFIKSSSYPLLPQLTRQFPQLETLRKNMERLQELNQGKTVRLSYKSAVKVGAPSAKSDITDLYSELSDDQLRVFQEKSGMELDKENFSIQLDKPFHTAKDLEHGKREEISMGTQMEDVLLGNGISHIESKIFENKWSNEVLEKAGVEPSEKLSGKDLSKVYNYLAGWQQEVLKKKLLRAYGLKSVYDINDKNVKFYEKLVKELNQRLNNRQDQDGIELVYEMIDENRNVSYTNKEGSKIKDGRRLLSVNFKIPLWILPNSTKFESVLNSLINKNSVNMKLPGFSGPVASHEGFRLPTQDLDSYIKEHGLDGVIFTDSWTGSLEAPSRREDGTLKSFQVLAPNKFRTVVNGKEVLLNMQDYVDPQTGRIDNNKLPKELRTHFTYRTPTSSHQSGALVEVVGFLPYAMGDAIIVPGESTTQLGEDFDIDVRNFYMLNTVPTENGIRAVSHEDILSEDELQELEKDFKTFQEMMAETIQDFDKGLFSDNLMDIVQLSNLQYLLRTAYSDPATNKLLDQMLNNMQDEEGEPISSENEIHEITAEIGNLRDSIVPRDTEDYEAKNRQLNQILDVLQEEYEGHGLDQFIEDYQKLRRGRKLLEKYIENQIVNAYTSVFSSEDPSINKLINQALNTDFAQTTADMIDEVMRQKTTGFSVFKPLYQNDVMAQGTDGNKGISIHSNWVTFTSLCQQFSNDENPTKVLNLNLRFGLLETDGTLGKLMSDSFVDGVPAGFKPRPIAVVNMENQNSSLDNQKLGIMGKRNENMHTINAFALMCNLGLDSDGMAIGEKGTVMQYPSLFISQPIIRDYVRLKEYYSSLTTDSKQGIDKLVFEELARMWKPTEENAVEDISARLTSENLYAELRMPSQEIQWQVLSHFNMLNNAAQQILEMQLFFNVESKGMGLSYFNVMDRMEMLEHGLENREGETVEGFHNLLGERRFVPEEDEIEELSKQGFIRLRKNSQVMIKPTTYLGHKIVNSTVQAYNMWGAIFPFDAPVFKEQIERILSNTNNANTAKQQLEMKYKILRNMQDYLYSNMWHDSREFYNLTMDTDSNQSLATLLQTLITAKHPLMKEEFFRQLDTQLNKKTEPSLIVYNQSTANSIMKNESYKSLERAYANNEIIKLRGKDLMWNGKPVTYKDLVTNLFKYSLIADQERGAVGFRNQFPIKLFEDMGIAQRLRREALPSNTLQHGILYNSVVEAVTYIVGSRIGNTIFNNNKLSEKALNVQVDGLNKHLNPLGGNATLTSSGDIEINSFEITTGHFVRQYFQHNPDDAVPLPYKKTKDLKRRLGTQTLKGLDKFTNPFGSNETSYEYLNVDGFLWELREDNNYHRLTHLGGFGMNEYHAKNNVNQSVFSENNIDTRIESNSILNLYDKPKHSARHTKVKDYLESEIQNKTGFSLLAQLLLPHAQDVDIEYSNLGEGINGAYSAKDNKVYLNENIAQSDLAPVMMEEILHSITKKYIDSEMDIKYEHGGIVIKYGDKATATTRQLGMVYEAAFNAVKAHLTKTLKSEEAANAKMEQVIREVTAAKAGIRTGNASLDLSSEEDTQAYRALDIHEFLAGMFFTPTFQEVLNNTEYKQSGQSIFKKFIDKLVKIFFPGIKENSVLEAAITNLTNYLAEKAGKEVTKKEEKQADVLDEIERMKEELGILNRENTNPDVEFAPVLYNEVNPVPQDSPTAMEVERAIFEGRLPSSDLMFSPILHSNENIARVKYRANILKRFGEDAALKQKFTVGFKNGWTLDKILSEAKVPKEYARIIKGYNINLREFSNVQDLMDRIVVNLMADLSYDVTIGNTEGNTWENITVPGGENYRQKIINIAGVDLPLNVHKDFEGGLGWIRMDDNETDTQTARVLEIQSDAMQKMNRSFAWDGKKYEIVQDESKKTYREDDKDISSKEYDRAFKEYLATKPGIVQALKNDEAYRKFQLLSFMQSVSREGYSSVMFPSGDTAAKVERHETFTESLIKLYTEKGIIFKEEWAEYNRLIEEISKLREESKEWEERFPKGSIPYNSVLSEIEDYQEFTERDKDTLAKIHKVREEFKDREIPSTGDFESESFYVVDKKNFNLDNYTKFERMEGWKLVQYEKREDGWYADDKPIKEIYIANYLWNFAPLNEYFKINGKILVAKEDVVDGMEDLATRMRENIKDWETNLEALLSKAEKMEKSTYSVAVVSKELGKRGERVLQLEKDKKNLKQTMDEKGKEEVQKVAISEAETKALKDSFAKENPIWNMYENVFSKMYAGYNPEAVTDENGNTWNKVAIDKGRDESEILLAPKLHRKENSKENVSDKICK